MNLIFYLIIFIFGASVGSFLNCVIYRLALPNFSWKNLGGLRGRSYCPHCRHQLVWLDLIPLLSFFVLEGKCRYCRKKISCQYPLVELFTGSIFLFITILNFKLATYGILNTCYLLLIACLLIIIFVYDLKHYIIPDKIIYAAISVSGIWYLVAGIFLGFYDKYEILNIICSAIGAAVFFLLIVLFSRGRWMGIGDIKLAFFMGLFLGYPAILVALFLAFFFGAIIGIGLIILGKKTLKSEVPFGPFLISGTALAFFWGSSLINWYLISL